MTRMLICAAASWLASCGASGTRPDDMSTAEHRQAAEAQDRQAAEHEAEYDPDARRTRRSGAGADEIYFDTEVYNPTEQHRDAAERHHEIADQHRAAAEALESFEEQECGSFPPATRATCPLLGQLSAVEDVPNGVKLVFAEDVNEEAAAAHVRCHVAFARTQGREGMGHCPMYVEGATAETDESGVTLLTTDDADAVEELRRRARAHLDE